MKNHLFQLVVCLALFSASCKSGGKDATEEKAPDTVVVAVPPQPVVIDSAAIAAKYNEERAKAPAKNQNTYKSKGGKMAKVDSDPTIATYDATEASKASSTTTTGTASAPKPTDDQGYYYYPSKVATFPGGEAALDKYLADNLEYPQTALDHGVEGTVYVDIYVDESGNIVDAVIKSKKIGFGLETEVLRVIKSMPRWNPGEYEAHTVKTKFTLPVVFDLK